MKNNDVARAWSRSIPAKAGNLWTDGCNLYSYRLRIGYTEQNTGRKVVLTYRAPNAFHSVTTSKHVNLAARYSDTLEVPNA
jgi:hypothetical protein